MPIVDPKREAPRYAKVIGASFAMHDVSGAAPGSFMTDYQIMNAQSLDPTAPCPTDGNNKSS